MSKLQVVNPDNQSKVPFLRGILTRSLQESGLGFEDAYAVAAKIREELAGRDQISSDELEARVVEHLKDDHSAGMLRRYQARQPEGITIKVQCAEGHVTAFSRSQHQERLETCGLESGQAFAITVEIYHLLNKHHVAEIESGRLGKLTYSVLKRNLGKDVAHRYLVSVEHFKSGRPLIILIGGTVGCGKSTVSNEVARRMRIVRTQSTDMLREVMRVLIPKGLMPVLHQSSFNAWKTLARRSEGTADTKTLMEIGYRAQAELLNVASEAVLERALRERVSMILEGVHITPEFATKFLGEKDAVIVPIQLDVPSKKVLKARIAGRGAEAKGRRAKRYLEEFEAIWQAQTFLISAAERLGVPIIENKTPEQAVHDVTGVIIDAMSKYCTASASEVFEGREVAV